jgi:hypothetical protein
MEWFFELHDARQWVVGMTAALPQPISWSEMAAWAAMTGRRPSPPEATVLRAMDRAWRETSSRLRREQEGAGAPEPANDPGPGGGGAVQAFGAAPRGINGR